MSGVILVCIQGTVTLIPIYKPGWKNRTRHWATANLGANLYGMNANLTILYSKYFIPYSNIFKLKKFPQASSQYTNSLHEHCSQIVFKNSIRKHFHSYYKKQVYKNCLDLFCPDKWFWSWLVSNSDDEVNIAAVVVLATRGKQNKEMQQEVWQKLFRSILRSMHMFKEYTGLMNRNNTEI